MKRPMIVCVDDQREVLVALERDLEPFAALCEVESCESAAEAESVLDDAAIHGVPVYVIISDCVMPERSGVEMLQSLHDGGQFEQTRSLLLTGQATHEDTIHAINQAHIDGYVTKPWSAEDLSARVRTLLTESLLDYGHDPMDAPRELLDADVLLRRMRNE